MGLFDEVGDLLGDTLKTPLALGLDIGKGMLGMEDNHPDQESLLPRTNALVTSIEERLDKIVKPSNKED